MRGGGARGGGHGEGEEPLQRRREKRRAMGDIADELDRGRFQIAGRRIIACLHGIEDLQERVVGVGKNEEFHVPMAGREPVPILKDLLQRRAAQGLAQAIGWQDGDLDPRHDPEGAETDALGLEELGIPRRVTLRHGPVGEDEAEGAGKGGEGAQGLPRPMCGGGERPGDRLLVDIALIGQGIAPVP